MAIETTARSIVDVDSAQVDAFVQVHRGQVIRPDHEGYDLARAVWNGMIDRRPGLIVQPSGVADVIAAVNFAREHSLLVSVRGGGHSGAGMAVCEGGLMIDMSAMKGIRVDPAACTARAQGGVTWGEFDRETQAFGLATTGGQISTTGVAGLTLGGGIGVLMRTYGLSSDNLISADVVTADGSFVVASEQENSDLFWGLRGGGGNFGVVTSFEFRLHELTTAISGMLIHPAQRAREVLRLYREFAAQSPDSVGTIVGMMTSPDGIPIVALVPFYAGPLDEGERLLKPLADFGPPVAGGIGPMPYTVAQSMLDEGFPAGLHVYWRSSFLRSIDDEVLDVLIAQYQKITSPLSAVLIEQFGGEVSRIPADATAFGQRDATYNAVVIARWADPAEQDKHIAWARETMAALEPFTSGGVYLNYLSDEGLDRIRAAYGAERFERLVALKNKYDPTNLFRMNQNIRPTV